MDWLDQFTRKSHFDKIRVIINMTYSETYREKKHKNSESFCLNSESFCLNSESFCLNSESESCTKTKVCEINLSGILKEIELKRTQITLNIGITLNKIL